MRSPLFALVVAMGTSACTSVLDIDDVRYISTEGEGGGTGAGAAPAVGGAGGMGGGGGDPMLCGNGAIDEGEQCDGDDFGGEDCVSLGFLGGTIACDACMVTGCQAAYAQDFEGDTMPSEIVLLGPSLWTLATDHAQSGSQSVRSGPLNGNEDNSISVTLMFDDVGFISFWHRESTEAGGDELRFYIDDNQWTHYDGENPWAQANYEIQPGLHTFEWRYDKDSSVNAGTMRCGSTTS